MPRIGKNLGLLLLIIIIGSILGGIISEIIGIIAPEGKIQQFFTQGPTIAISPSTWDLIVLSLTFGLSLKINVLSVMGILAGVFLFRKL